MTGWWAISADAFREALQRAYDGEDPGMLYTEYYANAETTDIPGPDTEKP